MKVLALRDPLTVRKAICRVIARAEVEDFAPSHEIVESAQGLLLRRLDVLHVNLVEVDTVGLEAPQALFHGPQDAKAGCAGGVWTFAHAETELGSEHHAVAVLGLRHPRAHDALRQSVLAVDIRSVDEAHA